MRLWCPGAVVVPAPNGRISTHDGGSMLGGPPRCTMHTYEAGYSLTAVQGARGLIAAGNELHLTFNPVLGGLAQIIGADRAGRGLVNLPGGVQTNRMGTVNVQVEVIARADRPWTQDLTPAGRASLDQLIRWLRDDLGIPDVWPAGPPPAYYGGANHPESPRDPKVWTEHAGYFGHSQVPENDHGDPGAIDVRVLAAAGHSTPVTKTPDGRLLTQVSTQVWGTRIGAGVHALADGSRAAGDGELLVLRGLAPDQHWQAVERAQLVDGAVTFDLATVGLHAGDWTCRVAYHPSAWRLAPSASGTFVVPLR